MIGQSDIKQKLRVDVAISKAMEDALKLWAKMYENKSPWLNKDVKSLNLAAAISSELSTLVTNELQVTITGGARAEYLQKQLDRLLEKIQEKVELGVAKGGLILKPYVSGDQILVDCVEADAFFPVSFDGNKEITAAIFSDQKTVEGLFYTRLELHQMTPGGCIIRNFAFRSNDQERLGQPVSLTEVQEWAELAPDALIADVDRPLFAYFKFPRANNIDPKSPLGVSCFARATELIKEADVQWSDLLWEFESGQRALYADVVAFAKDRDGNPILPHRRLYKALNNNGSQVGDAPFFEAWTPTLREENILRGLDAILKKIEFTCGLAYGTLSDPQTEVKTATEIKISRQRTYSTITSSQKALRKALEHLIWAMDVWASLDTDIHKVAPRGTYQTAFTFDDSVIVDKESQLKQDLQLVGSGLMGKVEFRMRNFGEDEETAKAKIAAIQAEQSVSFFEEE